MLATSKSSHRLCLLLKTLLILLCIYIKRVTAASIELQNATCIRPSGEVSQLFAFENDALLEVPCPIGQAIRYNDEALELKKVYKHKNLTQFKKFEKELKEMQKLIKSSLKVKWLREGQSLYRDNGNPVLQEKLSLDKSPVVLTLLAVGQSDAGTYGCVLDYPNLPKDACKYFNLVSSYDFELNIKLVSDVPDIKPVVSHPPSDKLVRRGENVTFECRKKSTLSHSQTFWFRSSCEPGDDPECIRRFLSDVDEFKARGDKKSISKYIFGEVDMDELNLFNVSEADMGHYGCLVENNKGFDIRLGHLNLIEVELRKRPISMTHDKDGEYQSLSTTKTLNMESDSHLNNNLVAPPEKYLNNLNASEVFKQNLTSAPIRENHHRDSGIGILSAAVIVLAIALFVTCVINHKLPCAKCGNFQKDKSGVRPPSPIVGIKNSGENMRQHLPTAECPDIYNIGKTSDGFISGLLAHNNDQFMSGSVCSRLLLKEKDPSISSNSNSDEASSWGKSMSSHGDNSRAFYLHTSNTTATTVPLYDHPPSTGTSRLCKTMVQDACIINPTYGLLRPQGLSSVDWSFPRRNLERLNKIGEGQFGEVWRYIARQKDGSDSQVAVKQLKNRVGYGQRERLELIAEIEIMKLVNDHPNVIKLLNYCSDDFEPLLLIMEYAENGKLQTYLRNCRKSYSCLSDFRTIITSKELVKFSYHIAKGMEYVASKGIIHRDLASRNILVSKDMVCKVADFGFARRVDDDCAYERSTANPVPVKWMAPEALVENKFTSKSDVFSFGILMWEIVTLGATPYESMASSEVYKKVTSGGRLERPAHCKEEFYQIMASCWSHDPTQRPSFRDLALQLEKLLISENDYIELDQYPEHAYYNILNTAEKEIVIVE